MFFQVLITAHNILRWLVLAAAAWALVRAYRGWLGQRTYTASDRQSGLIFSILYDLQVTLGILLAVKVAAVQSIAGAITLRAIHGGDNRFRCYLSLFDYGAAKGCVLTNIAIAISIQIVHIKANIA